MLNRNNFNDILTSINNLVRTTNLDSTGAIGEIVAELILLKAYDTNISANLARLKPILILKCILKTVLLKLIFQLL